VSGEPPPSAAERSAARQLTELRESIAEVDRSLLELLHRRMHLAAEVGRVKAGKGQPIMVPEVHHRVLNRARQQNDQAALDRFRQQRNATRQADRQARDQLQQHWLEHLIETDAPLLESLVLLWHDHFASRHRDVGVITPAPRDCPESPDLPADPCLDLTPDERDRYAKDGFFVRASAFGAADVEAFRAAAERVVAAAEGAAFDKAAAIERAEAAPADDYEIDGNRYVEAADATVQFEHRRGSRTIRVIEPFHHLDPAFEALLDDPRLVEPMRGIIGTERVALFTDKLNCKRPREGSRFRWHQDSPYWAHFFEELERLPNVMVALDDADEGNGCFRVIRGSHREGMLPGLEGDGELGALFTDPAHFDEGAQVLIEVPAGSLVFFSPHTVHGSQPNRSDEPRRAFVITYQPGGHRMFKVDAKREAGA